jgi:hypothetical protein
MREERSDMRRFWIGSFLAGALAGAFVLAAQSEKAKQAK